MAKKRRVKRKVEIEMKPSKTANALAITAIIFLTLNGILAISLSKWIIQEIQKQLTGVTLNQAALITYGIVWLILAFLVLITNNKIKMNIKQKNLDDMSWMWFLLVVSIVVIFTGRLESGILLLIASIIYLSKAFKAKKEKAGK